VLLEEEEEEEEGEVKLLMPKEFKEKLKLLPIFVASLKSFSQFLVQTPLNLEKTAPHHLLHSSQKVL
jgi:hypothetical protein